MRIRARHYATGEVTDVRCDRGRIVALTPPEPAAPDLEAGWVAPALFDLQINGCEGRNFTSERLTVEDVRHVVDVCRRHGLAGFCPTLITSAEQVIRHGLATLRRACEADAEVARAVPACHLEGPSISPEDGPRGAHPRAHVRPPDWDEFCRLQEAAGGRIRLVTLAPEHEGALRFIERLAASGVVAALGHTAADGNRIRDAVRAGARLSTHLGNGAHAVLPRHPNYLWDQLAEDGLWASLICDGHHLPASVVKCVLRVKSPARAVLTCDASPLAGLPQGRYRKWGAEFEVLPEGRVVVPGTGYLAGSGAFTDACLGRAVAWGGVGLHEALDMAGARPRELLGLERRPLEAGAPADLVLFDWEAGGPVQVRHTVVAGAAAAAIP
jgi:N-acetylglucosamine-6-phosphate deacetylase